MIVTIDDFKGYFTRNFPYLPVWSAYGVYKKGDKVYYDGSFYESKIDNNTSEIFIEGVLSTDWMRVEDNVSDYVSDEDIKKAMGEAEVSFNHAFAANCQEARVQMMYLIAFYLAYDLSVGAGGAYGMINFPATSVTVGSVSESYYVPKAYLEDPILGFFARNGFGLKYLNMVYPKLIGNVGVVAGWSLP